MKYFRRLFVSIFILIVTAPCDAQIPNYVPTDSLIGWWPFTGNANDQSVNGNDGTVLNGTILSNDRFSNANSSYIIDGINCPDAKGVSLPSPIDHTEDYSVSIWYQTIDSTKTDQSIFNSFPHEYIAVNFNYPYGGFDNKTCCFLGNGGWQIFGNTANWDTYNLMDWHHIVVVKDSFNIKFYQDGLLSYTQVISSGFNSGSFNEIVVGAISINGGSQCYETFKGRIDDVGVWNKTLTNCEILDLYNAQINTISSISQTGNTLTSNQIGANYQWLDCDNGNGIIPTETNQSYTPAISGSYALEVDYNGCIDTSICTQICFSTIINNPIDLTITISNNALFVVESSNGTATYQWQTDPGGGFQDLVDGGQYTGTTNDSLIISNTTLGNDNQLLRCLINNGACIDTTSQAILTIIDDSGIENIYRYNVTIYPNPTTNNLNIKVEPDLFGVEYMVINQLGQVLYIGNITTELTTVKLDEFSSGMYSIIIMKNNGKIVVPFNINK
ncbi:MAG: LamG-like jellyroll fold domain-containing protein [Crocinitomicaceae bacterium]